MPLALPNAWDDVQSFLQEKEYLSLFRIRYHYREHRRVSDSFVTRVAAVIKANPEHVKWVQAWLKLTFTSDPREDLCVQRISDDEALVIFINTTWQLYIKNPGEAVQEVNRYRKKYNYASFQPAIREASGLSLTRAEYLRQKEDICTTVRGDTCAKQRDFVHIETSQGALAKSAFQTDHLAVTSPVTTLMAPWGGDSPLSSLADEDENMETDILSDPPVHVERGECPPIQGREMGTYLCSDSNMWDEKSASLPLGDRQDMEAVDASESRVPSKSISTLCADSALSLRSRPSKNKYVRAPAKTTRKLKRIAPRRLSDSTSEGEMPEETIIRRHKVRNSPPQRFNDKGGVHPPKGLPRRRDRSSTLEPDGKSRHVGVSTLPSPSLQNGLTPAREAWNRAEEKRALQRGVRKRTRSIFRQPTKKTTDESLTPLTGSSRGTDRESFRRRAKRNYTTESSQMLEGVAQSKAEGRPYHQNGRIRSSSAPIVAGISSFTEAFDEEPPHKKARTLKAPPKVSQDEELSIELAKDALASLSKQVTNHAVSARRAARAHYKRSGGDHKSATKPQLDAPCSDPYAPSADENPKVDEMRCLAIPPPNTPTVPSGQNRASRSRSIESEEVDQIMTPRRRSMSLELPPSQKSEGRTFPEGTVGNGETPVALHLQDPQPSCSPMSISSNSSVEPPELCLSRMALMSSSHPTASEDTTISSQLTLVCSPRKSRRGVEPFFPNTGLPPRTDHPSVRLTVDPDVRSIEPPWRLLSGTTASQSVARAPSRLDTHSWSLPERFSPMMPEFQPAPQLPVVVPDPPWFPWSSAQPRSASHVEKPLLTRAPPVWAQSRQELCESLSYFRSYQGGVYSQKKRARGYLLDGHPSAQDLWHAQGKLIISHAGGNSATDKETKQVVLVNDQTVHSASCAALVNSYKARQAIALIAGNGYHLFPYNLEHRSYVVLGYYLITHAWEEPEPSTASPRGYFVRWKFLFQWIESQGQPWWISSGGPDDLSLAHQTCSTSEVHNALKNCQICGVSSPRIYRQGWVCTHSNCDSFFRAKGGGGDFLRGYHPEFLILKEEPPEVQARPLPIQPEPPVEMNQRDTTSRRFWKGWWCCKCGRLSCRERWNYWECHTCQNRFEIEHCIYQAIELALPAIPMRFQIGNNAGIASPKMRTIGVSGLRNCWSFQLPCARGTIHIVEANLRANAAVDSIFKQYQLDAKDPDFFRRYSMKTHKLKGRMLSHYFSQNSGEPYKYVGGTDNTVPLDKYPSVKRAATLIREVASAVLGTDPSFNEILSAAYMAEQKMEFHSDGERDLGPVVASLSLGSSATMRFRPIPSRHAVPEIFGGDVIRRKSPPIILTLTLRHGDVLIMDGAEIQEFYQHAVHPSGFRIAATARYINTGTVLGDPIAEVPSREVATK